MKILRSERGQASLMIGMMMMTFILLFAFVVNTGMLVNAKINLQNAADLAAYAGAATQARQLNDISYLNYEMRRQYKKFLFRYYVIGNMASGYFPRGGGGGSSSAPQWGPGPESSLIYGVPAVCVAFTSTGPADNYCQIGTLPGIMIPPNNSVLGAFDQINTTLGEQLTAIEQLREQNCGKIATADTTLLLLWLFNTSPDLQSLSAAVTGNDPASQNERAIMQVAQAAAQGLGLVPREFILNERINTLASYVNMPAQKGVKLATINALKQSADPAANERTIQAFLSAYYTLGNHTFSDDNAIVMDELLPSGDQSNLLALQPIKENFDAYSVQFQLDPNAVNGNVNSHNCDPQLTPVTVHNVPVGVSKDPSVLTFYAVRLTATAKVMFSPFGDMTLTAYAAARPFGSRIGPPETAAQPEFVMEGAASASSGVPSNSGVVGAIPNLPITAQEAQAALGPGKGWDNNSVLGALYSQFFPSGVPSGPVGQELAETNFNSGIQAAMVPNPAEGNVYNIPSGAPDPFTAAPFDTLHELTFWAPIVSPAKASDLKTVLGQDFAEVLQNTATPGNSISTGGNAAQALMTALGNNIYSYVSALGSAQGEILAGQPDASGRCNPGSCVQEGINLAHIQDPFEPSGQPIQLGSSIMIPLGDIAAYKTSYVSTLDSSIQAQGRVGYSVKFVSFDSLTKTGTDATGGGPVDKPGGFLDTQAQQDVVKIQH